MSDPPVNINTLSKEITRQERRILRLKKRRLAKRSEVLDRLVKFTGIYGALIVLSTLMDGLQDTSDMTFDEGYWGMVVLIYVCAMGAGVLMYIQAGRAPRALNKEDEARTELQELRSAHAQAVKDAARQQGELSLSHDDGHQGALHLVNQDDTA